MDKIKAAMEELAGQEPVRVILSKPKMKSNECKKVDIHRYRDFYQAERQVGKQMFHDNIPFSGLAEWQDTPRVSTTTSARPRWPMFRAVPVASPTIT